MAQQFLKKKFSFRGLFLRFFAIVILSLSVTVNVYAADSTDTKIKSLHDFYNHIVSLPFKVPNQTQNINSESKNISAQTNILTQVTSFLDKYYDSYTSGLALVLYPVKTQPPTSTLTGGQTSTTITTPVKLAAVVPVTTPLNSTSPRPSPYQGEGGKQIVYVPIPGPKGDTGPKGDKGEPGTSITNFQSSSNNPVAYMPVGITIPNPSQNFTGGEYASIANLTSNLFTNNTSNIITLNVSGNEAITGNSSIGGTLNVTGATTLSGNLNVTGSITGAMNPALTNGSVFFQDTAGISQDNANFFYDKTNHRLGLGTVAPVSTLHVNGTSTISSASDWTAGLQVRTSLSNGNMFLTFDDTANGTAPLQIFTSNSTGGQIWSYGSGTIFLAGNKVGINTGGKPGATDAALVVKPTSTYPILNALLPSGASAFYVANGGNVGIGTTAPNYALTLAGVADPSIALTSINNTNPQGLIRWQLAGQALKWYVGAHQYLSNDFEIGDASAARLVVQATSGNVGIGTTNPNSAKLDIYASGGGTGLNVKAGDTGTGTTIANFVDVNSVSALYIRGDNKVGIGTTSPGEKLVNTGYTMLGGATAHTVLFTGFDALNTNALELNTGVSVANDTRFGTLSLVTNQAGTANVIGSIYFGNSALGVAEKRVASFGAMTDGATNSGALVFATANAGTFAEKMRITSAGNVGIGTTGPGAKLQVSGSNFQTTFGTVAPTMLVQNTDSTLNALNSIAFQNAGGFYGAQVSYIPTSSATLNTGGALAFATKNTIDGNWTEGMRIINGNVGIGSTAPTVKLQVDHSSTNTVFSSLGVTDVGLSLKNTSSTDGNMSLISFVNAFGAGQGFIGTIFPQAGVVNGGGDLVFGTRQTGGSIGERMRLSNSGNLGIGETSPGRKLVITSSGTGAGSASLALNESGTRQWTIGAGLTTSGRFSIQNGSGGDPLTIDANNNVGIGTTAPTSVLSISNSNSDTTAYNSIAGMINLANINGTANTYNGINFQSKDSDSATIAAYAGILAQFTNTVGATRSSDLLFYVRNLNSLINPFIIKSSGNVGIGITAPVGKLDIEPSVTSVSMTLGSATGVGLALTGTGGNGAFGLYGGVDTGTGNSWLQAGRTNTATAYNLSLQASGGNVGIGTTDPATAKLQIHTASTAGLAMGATIINPVGPASGRATGISFGVTGGSGTLYQKGGIAFEGTTVNGNGNLHFLLDNTADSSNTTLADAVMTLQSGGNVGIGTTGPSAMLTVVPTSPSPSTGIGSFGLVTSGSYGGGIGFKDGAGNLGLWDDTSAQNLNFGYGTNLGALTTFMTANKNGNLTITGNGSAGNGTLSLSNSVAGGIGPTVLLQNSGGSGQGNIDLNTYGGQTVPTVRWAGIDTGNYTGAQVFYTSTGGSANQPLLERMRITGTGNVGIGTTSPLGKLHVSSGNSGDTNVFSYTPLIVESGNSTQNGISLIGSTNQSIFFGDSASPAEGIIGFAHDTRIMSLQSGSGIGKITLSTAGVERIRIDNNGNVGIGTTVPGSLLDVSKSVVGTALKVSIQNTDNTSGASTSALRIATGGSSSGDARIEFSAVGETDWTMGVDNSDANKFKLGQNLDGSSFVTVDTAGNVGIGTTAPGAPLEVKGTGTGVTIAKFTDVNTTGCAIATGGTIACSSDVRLKKNIENINYGLSTVMQLRPVLYNWNYETDGQTKSLGFIAQEVEALIPKLVATDDQGMKSLNTTGIIPILTKGIQELDLKITDLTDLNNLTKANPLRDALVAWFGNVGNTVGDFFANRVHTKELCVQDANGETCITRGQLDALISGASGSVVNNGGGNTPSPEPQPEPTPEVTPPAPETPPSDTPPAETPPSPEPTL